MDEVHSLIFSKNIRFILSGSSPRKLKRHGANLLGGRALKAILYPLVSDEIPDFDIFKAVRYGTLPRHYLISDVGYMIPSFTHTKKRRSIQAPKFYYFDVGIANYLRNRQNIQLGSTDFGHAFEHFIIQEIIAYLGYNEKEEQLSYWRTTSGYEVDVVIGTGRVAIEIKSVEEIQSRHIKGLKAFQEEFPDCRLIAVSFDSRPRITHGVEVYPAIDFLKKLWKHEIV